MERLTASCILHNFLRRTTRPPAGLSADREAAGLQLLTQVSSNNSSREAIRVREAYVSYFCNEGAVGWKPAV